MNVLLVSTYELGHQPFGLASPAAWLAERGHQVACADLCVESLDTDTVREADLVAFYLPMHTATRLAAKVIEKVRRINPNAHICCYGLYAPLNESYLRSIGAGTILGGEFEPGLVSLAGRLAAGSLGVPQSEPLISLDRLRFQVPLRSALPPLEKYAAAADRRRRPNGSATPKPAEAANICAAIARWCRCIRGVFELCSRRSCSRTFASRWPPAPNTSPSAIRISSTVPRTPCASWTRCTGVPASDLRRDHQDRAPAQASRAAAAPARDRLPVRHQRSGVDGRRGTGEARQRPHARRFHRGRARVPVAPVSRSRRPLSRSRPGPRASHIAKCWRCWWSWIWWNTSRRCNWRCVC